MEIKNRNKLFYSILSIVIIIFLVLLPNLYMNYKNLLVPGQNNIQSYFVAVNSSGIFRFRNHKTDVNLTFFITKDSIELKKKGLCKNYRITVFNKPAYMINGTYIIPDESTVTDELTVYPLKIHYEHIPIVIGIKKINETAVRNTSYNSTCHIGIYGNIIGLDRYKGLNIKVCNDTRNETLYELTIIPETYKHFISNYYWKSFFFVLPLIMFAIIYDSIGTILMIKNYYRNNIIDKYKGIFYTVYIAYLIILQSTIQEVSYTNNIFALLGFILTFYLLAHFLILLWLEKEIMKIENTQIANYVYIKKYHSYNIIVSVVIMLISYVIIYKTLNIPEAGKLFPLMTYYYMTLRNLVIIMFLRIYLEPASMITK